MSTTTTIHPDRVTSRPVRRFADTLRMGLHPLITGPVGDLALIDGEAMPYPDALVQLVHGSFDLVVRINAADGLRIVHGDEELYDQAMAEPDQPQRSVDEADNGRPAERQTRLRRLTQWGANARDDLDVARQLLTQDQVSVLIELDQLVILLQDPEHHPDPVRARVAALQLGLRDASQVGRYRNTCAMLASTTSRVPAVLLDGCEDVALVHVEAPSREERTAFLASRLHTMHDADSLTSQQDRDEAVEMLGGLTEGESLRSLAAIVYYSRASRTSVRDARDLVNAFRLGRLRPDPWRFLQARFPETREILEQRVFGQPEAIEAVMGALAGAGYGLDMDGKHYTSESQPRGVLWLLGPTGVGKTELAKAIALAVFGDKESMVRLDMSTFGESHSKARLVGAPPGYVGHDSGGELTNAVRDRPNSVVLLDEIDKAHPDILEELMSAFDDGRLTDGQGRLVHFGDTVFIATSNEGASDIRAILDRDGPDASYEDIRDASIAAVRRVFQEREQPYVLNRIQNVIAFDVLRPATVDALTRRLLEDVRFRTGPDLEHDVESACSMARQVMADPYKWVLGGRQLRNELLLYHQQLAVWLATHGHHDATRVHVSFEGLDMYASVDGAPTQIVRPSSRPAAVRRTTE